MAVLKKGDSIFAHQYEGKLESLSPLFRQIREGIARLEKQMLGAK
jgi:hypothetical protein